MAWVHSLRRKLGFSLCAGCGDISSVELQYSSGEAVIVEYYCNQCKESVFERTKSEPEDPKELAEFYGCQKASSIPQTSSSVISFMNLYQCLICHKMVDMEERAVEQWMINDSEFCPDCFKEFMI